MELKQEKWRKDFSMSIAEMFKKGDSFTEMSDIIDYGTFILVGGEEEIIEKLTEEGKNLCEIYDDDLIPLIPGKEIITPAGTMLVPQDRPLWVLGEAASLLEDMGRECVRDDIESIRKEFDFIIGFSNVVLGLQLEDHLHTTRSLFQLSDMLSRSMKYKKELVLALEEIAENVVPKRVDKH